MKESGKTTGTGIGDGPAVRGVNYWARVVSREELPLLRPTVMTIARIFSQAGAPSSAMADAVARDPFMTARVLRMANSAYYNPGLKKVSAIPRAVVVVGFDAVRHLCVSARFVEETYGGERLQEILRRVVSSYQQALVAQWVGETLRDPAPEELYAAGLLLDMGLLALLCVIPSETVSAFREKSARCPVHELPSVEREVFGIESRRLTARLAEEWTLGEIARRAAQEREDPDVRIQCVRMGAALTAASARGREMQEWATALEVASERLKISESVLMRLLDTAEKRARDFSLELPLALESALEGREQPNPMEIQWVTGEDAVVLHIGEPSASKDQVSRPADAARQLELLDDLCAYLLDEKRGHIHGLLERLALALMEGAGLDRVVFLRLTPDGRFLEVKELYGAFNGRLRGLLIPVSSYTNAFAHVLTGPPWLWVHEKSPPSLKVLVTPEVLQFFPSREFFVGRIGLPPRAAGVLAGDRRSGGESLDEEAFHAFRRLCALASLGTTLLRP